MWKEGQTTSIYFILTLLHFVSFCFGVPHSLTHGLQGPRRHGFDGFGRTHQFSKRGSGTHQFLRFSKNSHLDTKRTPKISKIHLPKQILNPSIEISVGVPGLWGSRLCREVTKRKISSPPPCTYVHGTRTAVRLRAQPHRRHTETVTRRQNCLALIQDWYGNDLAPPKIADMKALLTST